MDLGCEPWILTKFLVGNLDCRCPRCMAEGSRHGALLWAGRHGSCGPCQLVVGSGSTDSSVKTYQILFFCKIHVSTDANTGEVDGVFVIIIVAVHPPCAASAAADAIIDANPPLPLPLCPRLPLPSCPRWPCTHPCTIVRPRPSNLCSLPPPLLRTPIASVNNCHRHCHSQQQQCCCHQQR